ncbi:alpha/beta hydrolase [Bifidobacterium simiarum]|uniref:Esterase n=1 Tax=Bifidobacterium simiarum TaxID=2045441 RepID=A0A2M9HFV7_9BIFI|nr:alpha/beta hydrolase [Bifidobacterium simiarum]PJM75714.1 esterase [Bifidobacterium simiarum]
MTASIWTEPPRLVTPEGVPYETWTEIDGDLGDLPVPLATAIARFRLAFARGDESRVPYWQVPDGVDVIADLPYADDADGDGDADPVRGHRLDLYLPHEAVVRGGHTLPVYVDIHGGGFVYGYKELNRNFCVNLAARGFAVFSLNYRPAPQTDLIGQLRDVNRALAWIRDHRGEYPIAQDGVWLTGDSAGACLAFLTTAIERPSAASVGASAGLSTGLSSVAKSLGITPSGIGVNGAALVSGVYDIARYVPPESGEYGAGVRGGLTGDPQSIMDVLAEPFYGCLRGAGRGVIDTGRIVRSVDLPPIFLNTSSDDFIESETLKLAVMLAEQGVDFELHDWKTAKAETLGHVFPVCMSWLPESQRVLDLIRDFTYARL